MATTNGMVTAPDLDYLPGAPFEDGEVDSAVETLRNVVRWHIAPQRSETVTLDVSIMQRRLFLMTTHLVSVDEIRARGEVVDPGDYSVSPHLCRVIRNGSGYWPSGYAAVEVDMTHGYETVPRDLLSVIAAIAATSRRDQSVREAVAGPWTMALIGIDKIIERYDPRRLQLGMA